MKGKDEKRASNRVRIKVKIFLIENIFLEKQLLSLNSNFFLKMPQILGKDSFFKYFSVFSMAKRVALSHKPTSYIEN